MQKHILFVCMLCNVYTYAMEEKTPWPYINITHTDYNTTKLDPLFIKLSEKYPDIPYICLSQKDILSHESPVVKMVHSQQYLNLIEKHPSIMLSGITHRLLPALYPNCYSRTYFTEMLKECSTTVAATKLLIERLQKKELVSRYAISLAQGYSFAGHAEGNNGHAYAPIVMSVLHALNTEIIKHIVIIDENISRNKMVAQEYYEHGNGSILFSTNNTFAELFENKIIVLEKMPAETLWKSFTDPENVIQDMLTYKYRPGKNILNFINSYHHSIDLAFYNINIENENETRLMSITNLLNKLIPTVFILSGDKNKYKETAYSIIDHIINVTKLCAAFNDYLPKQLSASKSSSSSSSEQGSLDDNSDETLSSSTDDHNDICVFKVTMNKKDTWAYDGANFIYLAKNITIENNIMEIELDDHYTAYGGYKYHSPTSSEDSEYDEKYNEEEI